MANREIPLDAVVVAAPEQVSSDLVGEAVILNLKDGMYYGLNEVGARIWSLIQQPRTVASLCDVLMDEYDIDATQCERQVLTLLRKLDGYELIEVR